MKERDIVWWFCTYTPLEILDAAGLAPARRFGDPLVLESADALLHPAICPYIRACLAHELVSEGPHDAVFVNSCDGMRRLHDAWKDSFPEAFVHLMDLPRNVDGTGERLLAAEFKHLAGSLEEARGARVTAAGLIAAGHARERERLEYLRRAEGVAGVERLRLVMDVQARGGRLADALYRADAGGPAGVPVLLTGNLLNPSGLVAELERAGARVLWMDLCNGDRSLATSTMPEGGSLQELYLDLARRYLERPPCARMSDSIRRYDLLVDRIRDSGARGLIYASLKFCDSYLYDFPRVQSRLKDEGIPVLRLESDYADGHVGQLSTRIEAFLEMI